MMIIKRLFSKNSDKNNAFIQARTGYLYSLPGGMLLICSFGPKNRAINILIQTKL